MEKYLEYNCFLHRLEPNAKKKNTWKQESEYEFRIIQRIPLIKWM